ncbi:MAG: zinc ribbon domain-containing protein, partial [Desulfobaccales bacterium]
MPQCPHCQTEYDKGQRYCSVCGSFLLHPEEGDTFCPQCGVRVSPRQEFCHECDAPLKEGLRKVEVAPGAAPPEPAPQPTVTPASSALPSWVIGALAGAGIIIIILLIVLFSRTSPT